MSVYVCMCWTVGALIRTDKGGVYQGVLFLERTKGGYQGGYSFATPETIID